MGTKKAAAESPAELSPEEVKAARAAELQKAAELREAESAAKLEANVAAIIRAESPAPIMESGLSFDGGELSAVLKLLRTTAGLTASLPILSHVHGNVADGRAVLTSTDLEATLSITLPANGSGRFCLPITELGQVADFGGGGQVHLCRAEEEGAWNVRSRSLDAVLVGLDPEEFPESPNPEHMITLQGDRDTVDRFSRAVKFASVDESRPFMTGVCLDGRYIVATDAHRLLIQLASWDLPDGEQYLIPIRFGALLRKLNPAGFDLAFSHCHVRATGPNFTLYHSLIEGQFPNYKAVVPDPETITWSCQVNSKMVLGRLGALKGFGEGHGRTAIGFDCKTQSLRFGVEHNGRTALAAKVPAVFTVAEGEGVMPPQVAFAGHYLADLARLAGDGDMVISGNGSAVAGHLIRFPADSSMFAVQMPMEINS
jgi:hypothetical protein